MRTRRQLWPPPRPPLCLLPLPARPPAEKENIEHSGQYFSYLVLVVEPVYFDLHPAPTSLPEVHNLAQVGQAGPELTEEHRVVSHRQALHPVTDLRREISFFSCVRRIILYLSMMNNFRPRTGEDSIICPAPPAVPEISSLLCHPLSVSVGADGDSRFLSTFRGGRGQG